MQGKLASILLFLLLVSTIVLAHNVQPIKASGTIYMHARSIELPTAPTSRSIGVAAQDPPDWWPMFHHDLTHTGYSTSTAPNTNQTVWNYTTGSYVDSPPTVFGGVVYVGSDDDNVYALNATTGAKVWNYTTGSYVDSSPAAVGGVVYVGSGDGKVYALNATTGAKVWNYTTGYWVDSSPAAVGGVVYVGSDDTKVYALNAATGALIWSYTTGNAVASSPAVAGGIVYVGSYDNRTYALNATTGTLVWSYTTGGYVSSSPAVVAGVVYVGSDDDNVYALNATTGAKVWNYTTGNWVYSSPAVFGGVVYVGSDDGRVYALNAATGALIWSYPTGYWVESSPAVVADVVYVGSGNTKVYALNAATGALIWSYTTGNAVYSSPAVAGGMVYFGSEDRRVYAFGGACVSTPTGTNVTVTFTAQNVSVTFDNVTSAGFTTLDTTNSPISLFPSVACVDITTTATYSGNVTLTFPYDPDGLSLQDQQAMKIWLWNDSSSCWVDITTSVNNTSHTVYGVSPHLSVFGITRDVGLTGDLGVQGTTTVSIPSTPPPPPPNLSVLNYYQVNTTKNLGTPINLSLAYNPVNIQPGQEMFTQIWLWNDSSANWVDITSSVNATTHTVYGVSPHLSVFGITNLQSAPTGIAVTSVNFPKTVVCQGYNATIGFTITNQGDTTQQNFNILLYCNTTLLATFPIARLDPQGQIALSINWSTTNWVKGNYSINTCSNSIHWIKLTIVGDVNGDGKVNLIDVFAVALAYGSSPGYPTWNPNYDINNDGKINLIDYFITALNYGKTDS